MKSKLDSLYSDKSVLDSVYANIDDINIVASADANITVVVDNIDNITSLVGSMGDVESAIAIATDITTVSSNISVIQDVSDNKDNINTLVANMASILTVSDDLNELVSEIDVVGQNLQKLESDIETVSINIDKTVTVANNIANVNTIADNIAALLNAGNATAFVELEFVGTEAQSSFGFNYTDSAAIEAFYNGRLLSQSDWYLTGGNTLILVMPIDATGDVITVRTWNRFSITDAITDEDLQVALNNTYSKSEIDYKVTYLTDAISVNTRAIANMSSAQASFSSSTYPAIASIPITPTQLLWDVDVVSTNATIMTVNANNTITFLGDASFNFISTIELVALTANQRHITFTLVNVADNSIIGQEVKSLEYPNGTTFEAGFNTLLTIGRNGLPSAPVTIRVEVRVDSMGYRLNSFKSILISSSLYDQVAIDVGTIPDFEDAL
jgi:hypothetical protein